MPSSKIFAALVNSGQYVKGGFMCISLSCAARAGNHPAHVHLTLAAAEFHTKEISVFMKELGAIALGRPVTQHEYTLSSQLSLFIKDGFKEFIEMEAGAPFANHIADMSVELYSDWANRHEIVKGRMEQVTSAMDAYVEEHGRFVSVIMNLMVESERWKVGQDMFDVLIQAQIDDVITLAECTRALSAEMKLRNSIMPQPSKVTDSSMDFLIARNTHMTQLLTGMARLPDPQANEAITCMYQNFEYAHRRIQGIMSSYL